MDLTLKIKYSQLLWIVGGLFLWLLTVDRNFTLRVTGAD